LTFLYYLEQKFPETI